MNSLKTTLEMCDPTPDTPIKDAIAICRETTQMPDRQARAAGEDLPWTLLPIVFAFAKLSRALGFDPELSAIVGDAAWSVHADQALVEIPDVIAYLARFYGLQNDEHCVCDNDSQLIELALGKAEAICRNLDDECSRSFPRILIGYDDPGHAIRSVHSILATHIKITSDHKQLSLKADYTALIPLIPNLIARLNRAYIALAKEPK